MEENSPEKEPLFPEAEIRFASTGSRIGASMLDGLILSVVVLPVTYFNVVSWKIPYLFILTSLFEIIYKPFMEYRYGATLGKMAAGIEVLGQGFQRVSFNEEMRRVSFYMIPSILQFFLTVRTYFSPEFYRFTSYNDYNQFTANANPATLLLGLLVFFLGVADGITFLMNPQRRALHDLYAGTYVVEKY